MSKEKIKEVAATKKVAKESKKEKSGSTEASFVKNGIAYYNIIATCVCGGKFETGSTQPEIRVDICSSCHPFFTGEARLMDIEGRVEKFRKKYNLSK